MEVLLLKRKNLGIIALPFLALNPKIRALCATGLLVFYQIMLLFGGWREYAIESIHGGILGTIFGFSSLMIFATCIGEFLLMNKNYSEKVKYRILAILCLTIFIGGILLSFIPQWYANKRQVTLTYILISLGASILISYLFILIDKMVRKPILVLDSYGKNFFLTYIIAVVIEYIITEAIGYEIDLIVGVLVITIITIFVVVMDKREIIIKL